MTDNIFQLFESSARQRPDAIAVHYEGRQITYGHLLDETLRVAALLRALGVREGDRVLIYSPNTPEYLSVFYGCAHVGAVLAPVNDTFRMTELRYIAKNASADVAFVHASILDPFLENLRGSLDAPSKIVALGTHGATPAGVLGAYERLLAPTETAPAVDCAADAPGLIVYTSGSTTVPKAVLHTHGSLHFSLTTYAAVWEYTDSDIAVVSPPMSWVFGLILTSAAMLTVGTTVVLLRRFHPERVLEAVEQFRATLLFGTMSMYTKMLDVLNKTDYDMSSLQFCMIGGEPCPDSLLKPVEARFGLRFCQAWAFSENHPLVLMRPQDKDAPRGTAGRPAPGVEIRLIDPDGNEVTGAGSGEAWVRGPGAMTCYFGNPELTAERIDAEGWIQTGDLLKRDEDGYLFVVGRASEMIIRSGANIAPAEVETALLEHPDIASACVVGIPDRRSGEAIVAFVTPRNGAEIGTAEILDHLRSRLARYKLPQEILLMQTLPVTANNKIDRKALKQIAIGRLTSYA